MTKLSVLNSPKPHKGVWRRFSVAVAALMSVLLAPVISSGTSQAWTNTSQAYNLVQNSSWGNVIDTDGLGNSYVEISVVL
jgi:hypothetical protein